MAKVQTVTGPCDSSELGTTLVHEHLKIGFPGWEMDGLAPTYTREEVRVRAIDKLQELQGHGVATYLDPCPVDLGRDVEFMAEVAQRSGMRVICATGAYKEDQGLTYTFAALPMEEIRDIYIKELTEGVGDTGIRAGLVKVATGSPTISPYELKLLTAGGMAAAEVGCPVLTHTDDACCGQEQLQILIDAGVPAHRIMVGHSDGRSDHAYHRSLADAGAYLGFDRFGIHTIIPDEERIKSVMAMVQAGYRRSIFLSHDSICTWLGRPIIDGKVFPAGIVERLAPDWNATHLFKRILPEMRNQGLTEEDERVIFEENPRRYFEGEVAPNR